MKKEILFICLLFICCNFYAQQKEVVVIETNYDMPAFDNPQAVLIDKNNVDGRSASIVRITNYSKFRSIEFEVFVHSPLTSSWESLGVQRVSGFDTDVKFGQQYPNLEQYRYFAVVPKSVNKNDLQYKIEKKGGKLDVSLFNQGVDMYAEPLPFHEASNAFVFTKDLLPHGAKENICLENKTSNTIVSVSIYGWNQKKLQWVRLSSIAAHKDEPAKNEPNDKYTKYKYLSIVSSDNKKYEYSFRERHDDWYISVQETF